MKVGGGGGGRATEAPDTETPEEPRLKYADELLAQ